MLMKNLKVLAASLLLCSSIPTMADGYRTIEIREFNGSVTTVEINDDTTTEFYDGKIYFFGCEMDLEFDRNDVKSFNFVDTPTGIESVNADGTSPKFEKGRMSFSNLPAGSRIMIVSASGKIISDVRAEGDYCLSLDNLPNGVYVVKVNSVSYKVTVK